MKQDVIPPHIVIIVPCIDKPTMKFSQSLATITYRCGIMKMPLAIMHQGGSMITRTRNLAVDWVEKEIEQKQGVPVSYLFWLDSDMEVPPDVLLRLLQHNKDIVGCTYVRRTPPFDVHGRTLGNKPYYTKNEILLEMAALPGGCLLVKRDVFKKLYRPYFRALYKEETELGKHDEQEFGEDYSFCAAARAAGYKIWLDVQLSKEVGHSSERVLYPEQHGWEGMRDKMTEPAMVANG